MHLQVYDIGTSHNNTHWEDIATRLKEILEGVPIVSNFMKERDFEVW